MRKLSAEEFKQVTDALGSDVLDTQKAYELKTTLKVINDTINKYEKKGGNREQLAALYRKKYALESGLRFSMNAFTESRVIYDFSTDGGKTHLSDHLGKLEDVFTVNKRPDGYLEVGYKDFDPNARKVSLAEPRVTKILKMHRTELAQIGNDIYNNPSKNIKVAYESVAKEIGGNPIVSDGQGSLNTEHLMKSETGRDILEMTGRLKDREKMSKVVPTKESAAPNDMTYGTPNLKPLNKHTDYYTPVNGSAMDFQHYSPASKGIGIEGLNPLREHVVKAESINKYIETMRGEYRPSYEEHVQTMKEVTGVDVDHGTIGNPTHLDVRGC